MFWHAFFNPTYFPSLFLRMTVCTSLAGIWALVTGSRIDAVAHLDLKRDVLRWSARWLVPAFVLMPFLFGWYLASLPESRLALLQTGISTIGAGTFTQVTRVALITIMTSATIVAIVYFLAWRSPADFSLGHAAGVLLLALAATGATEFGREMLRKPYVVGDHLYSKGVRKYDVAAVGLGEGLGLRADDGLRAVAVAVAERPNAVLMDVEMPGMSGLEALGELRRRGNRAPVLLMSGADHEDSARDAGVPFLAKPFSLDALRAALEALLQRD